MTPTPVIVDTPVWSAALRRRSPNRETFDALKWLIDEKRVTLLGPIRQELLSGVRDSASFERLRTYLRAFPDQPITTDDYEQAGRFYNTCRARGVQGSHVDYLICAVAERLGALIYTSDADFVGYVKLLPITLFAPL